MSVQLKQISFTSCVKSDFKFLDTFDDYFCLSGRKYRVIKSTENPLEYIVKKVNDQSRSFVNLLKIASYLTGFIPFIMFVGKIICRAQYRFVVEPSATRPKATDETTRTPSVSVDGTTSTTSRFVELPDRGTLKEFRSKFQEYQTAVLDVYRKKQVHQSLPDFKLTDEQKEKISQALHFAFHKNIPNWLKIMGGGESVVLFIDGIPDFVVKLKRGENSEALCLDYVQRSIKARKIVEDKNLYMLHVPHAQTLEVDGRYVVLEERVPLEYGSYRDQKGLHKRLLQAPDLNESAREMYHQLAVFISTFGFSDVKYDNIPVTKEGRIALVDLDVGGASGGFLRAGAGKHDGLFNYIPIDWIPEFKVKYGHGIELGIEKIKGRRQNKPVGAYKKYLSDIKVEYSSQKLKEDADCDFETPFERDIAKEVLRKLNTLLEKSRNLDMVTGRKVYLRINTQDSLTQRVKEVFCRHGEEYCYMSLKPEKKQYRGELRKVLSVLKEKGRLFDFKISPYYPSIAVRC